MKKNAYTLVTVAAALALASAPIANATESHALVTRTNADGATAASYVTTNKTTIEKALQGFIAPLTANYDTAPGGKVDLFDRSELTWAALGWGAVMTIVASKVTRSNVENGRAPFLGFVF